MKNEHIYVVSPEFQAWWETRCTVPEKALMEKMQAWGAWQEQQKKTEEALEVLKKIAAYDTCHQCSHKFFNSGAYCAREKDNCSSKTNQWKYYEPVHPAKKMAKDFLEKAIL